MPTDSETLIEQTHDLRARARDAYRSGDLAGAESLYESARLLAQQGGDEPLEDLCACSRAGLAIELERGDSELPALRALLLRNSTPFTGFLAAYWIARHYELKKDYGKALFYGQAALKRARVVDESEPISGALNLVGNALLAQGYFAEAGTHFEAALAAAPSADPLAGALFGINLGYCQVLTGEPKRGLGNLLRSARYLRRLDASRYLAQAHLDASYGYLEIDRPAAALRHGRRALELAVAVDWTTGQKNALYLLGQSARLNGDAQAARAHFASLQADFYPRQPYLPDFLMSADIRALVNLHA